MVFEQDGDLKRRYLHGPTGEALFDQAFDAANNPPLQPQADLLQPLGDHQHSTRLVLGPNTTAIALEILQSIDYGAFDEYRSSTTPAEPWSSTAKALRPCRR